MLKVTVLVRDVRSILKEGYMQSGAPSRVERALHKLKKATVYTKLQNVGGTCLLCSQVPKSIVLVMTESYCFPRYLSCSLDTVMLKESAV